MIMQMEMPTDKVPSWLRRMTCWGRTEVAKGTQRGGDGRAPVEFYTVRQGISLGFPLRTVDRREWRVELPWAALETLAGTANPTRSDIERTMARHAHHLEFAALRTIARGAADGDLVVLSADSLGL
jgi:hypothetical protein